MAKELGLNRCVSEQPAYSLIDRRIERELVPMAQTYGLAILPWSPTAGGFLTGRYRRGEPLPAGSRFEAWWRDGAEDHMTDAAFDVLDALEKVAARKGCAPATAALAWTIAQPGVTSAITGPRSVEHVRDAVAAIDVTLDADDLATLDAAAPPGAGDGAVLWQRRARVDDLGATPPPLVSAAGPGMAGPRSPGPPGHTLPVTLGPTMGRCVPTRSTWSTT